MLNFNKKKNTVIFPVQVIVGLKIEYIKYEFYAHM